MKRKRSDSSVRGLRIAKRKRVTRRRKIDYSDIPALSRTQLAAMRRIGRAHHWEMSRDC
jgi:hypothetical protein